VKQTEAGKIGVHWFGKWQQLMGSPISVILPREGRKDAMTASKITNAFGLILVELHHRVPPFQSSRGWAIT